MEMKLDKRQIQVIFLFEFKMGCNAVETTCNINNTFGPGAANRYTVQWWFKKFCKGGKCLEDEEHSGQPLEVDIAEELSVKYSTIVWHLKQIGKVKSSLVSSLILHNCNEPFLNRIIMCNEKWILYDNRQRPHRRWTEKKLQRTSQSQTCTKKRLCSLFGGLLPV
ncbi:hypothetical protein FD754_009536 [Muntiacus muntjak]|uniref:Mos1 transposase HTH domain-containing protein n=1 Tax=Muntiacus muntjak TaxID=9888 RepID=A0A5N3WU87_MUNMU|nr:hypothetical protein FD754_009536 [Muntiacus muntjak]